MKNHGSTLKMIFALVIFGTIAPFARQIGLPTSMTAMIRGLSGAVILLLVLLMQGKKPEPRAIRENLWQLLASGAAMGLNWMLLFEAYNYTTAAKAILCYYLAPTFVTVLAPFVLKEKPTLKGLLCASVSLGGMILLSGNTGSGERDGLGILFGVLAAALYAAVILINKRTKPMPSYDRTIVQLAVAGTVLIPYVLVTQWGQTLTLSATGLGALAVVCLIHTALAYFLYFGGMEGISAAKTAVLAYLDPVIAVLISATLLHEPMTWKTAAGAVLVLGAALTGELLSLQREKETKV